MHPVTCSLLWVRCLFDRFSISDFGGKWPLKWKFSNMSFQIPRRYTEVRFVTKFGENRPLRSCRKVVWITTHNITRAPRDSSQPPFCPKLADRAQNSLNIVTPWHVHVYRIWSGSATFAGLFRKDSFFSAQKVNTINYRLSAYNKCSSTMYSPSVMEQTCVYVYLDVFQFIRNNPQCQSRMSNFVGRWTHIHCSLCK